MISVLRRPGTEGVLLVYPETNPRTKELAHLIAVAVSGYQEHEVAQIIAADLLNEINRAESWIAGPGVMLNDALSRLEPVTVQGGVSVSCAVCIRKGRMVQTATCGDFSILLLRPGRSGFIKGRELQRNTVTEGTYGLAADDSLIVVSRQLLDELTGDELPGMLRGDGRENAPDLIEKRLQGVTFGSPQALILSKFQKDLPAMGSDVRPVSPIDTPEDDHERPGIPSRKIMIPAAVVVVVVCLVFLIRYTGIFQGKPGSDEIAESTENTADRPREPVAESPIPTAAETTSIETLQSVMESVESEEQAETIDDTHIPSGEPGDLQWKVRMGGSNFSSSPTVGGRKLYVGSKDAHLYCLSTTSGEIIWKFQTGGGIGSSPVFAGKNLCFGSYDSTFYCIDRHSGELVWKHKVHDRIVSSPNIQDGIVYCGCDDHSVYAWRLSDGTPFWSYATGGVVWAQPVIHGGRVFFGSLDGYCYCVDARTGDLIWKHPAGGKIYAAAAPVDEQRIIFATAEGTIFMLRTDSGEPLWELRHGGIYSTPLVHEKLIYFGTRDGTFHCLTVEKGNQIWSMATTKAIRSSPVISGSTVYIGGYDGKLYALNRDNGEKDWEYDTKSRIYSTPVIARGMVFFGDLTGWLHALNASPG